MWGRREERRLGCRREESRGRGVREVGVWFLKKTLEN